MWPSSTCIHVGADGVSSRCGGISNCPSDAPARKGHSAALCTSSCKLRWTEEHAWLQGARCNIHYWNQACSSPENLETNSKNEPLSLRNPGSHLALVEILLGEFFNARGTIGIDMAMGLMFPLKGGSCIGGLLCMSTSLQICLVPRVLSVLL